jgi:hypothetical protein
MNFLFVVVDGFHFLRVSGLLYEASGQMAGADPREPISAQKVIATFFAA